MRRRAVSRCACVVLGAFLAENSEKRARNVLLHREEPEITESHEALALAAGRRPGSSL